MNGLSHQMDNIAALFRWQLWCPLGAVPIIYVFILFVQKRFLRKLSYILGYMKNATERSQIIWKFIS